MHEDTPAPRTGHDRDRSALRPVLRALIRQDPRSLRERCRRRRRAAGAFLPLDRLVVRALTRAAHAAGASGRRRALPDDESVDRSIAELCDEQWTEEDLGVPLDPARDLPFYRTFARAVGVDLGRARLACVALNALPRDVRRAFFAVHLAGSEARGPAAERRLRDARRALRRVLERTGERGGATPGSSPGPTPGPTPGSSKRP